MKVCAPWTPKKLPLQRPFGPAPEPPWWKDEGGDWRTLYSAARLALACFRDHGGGPSRVAEGGHPQYTGAHEESVSLGVAIVEGSEPVGSDSHETARHFRQTDSHETDEPAVSIQFSSEATR